MYRSATIWALSLGLGAGLGSCTAPLPEEQTSTTTQFPLETSYAVPVAGLEACKAELVKVAPASESDFRIYDYQPQPDGSYLIYWRTSDEQAGTCTVDATGRVASLANVESPAPATPGTTPVSPGVTPADEATAKSAVLNATDPNSEINVRSQPSLESDSPHYGVVGDKVQVVRETRGSDGDTWYFVKFDETDVEGWVRSDFIRVNGAPSAAATRLQASTLIGMGKTEAIEVARLNGFNIVDDSDPAMVLMSNTNQQLMLTINSVDDTISNATLR